jgi:hypothetical protein
MAKFKWKYGFMCSLHHKKLPPKLAWWCMSIIPAKQETSENHELRLALAKTRPHLKKYKLLPMKEASCL